MTVMIAGHRPSNARELVESMVDRTGSVDRLRPDRIELVEQLIREGRIGLDPTGCKNSPNRRASKVFRIRELAEAFLGERYVKQFERLSLRESVELMEAPAYVSANIFPQITSQLLFSEVRSQFDVEANVFSPLFPVIPSDIKDTEIVPSITNIDPDDVESVAEAQSYPRVGVTEEYFEIPGKTKKGAIIELTREAVRFDRTGMLVDQARGVGGALGANKENNCIDVLIGQTNNYSRNGTATDTYLTAGAYVNNVTSLPLQDWNDFDAAQQYLAEILDPSTSEPLAINLRPEDLVVMPRQFLNARRIFSATEVREHQDPAGGARTTETNSPNPLGYTPRILTSQRLYQRVLAGPESEAAKAQLGWFLGSIAEAFAWYECWALNLAMQGRDSHDGFDRDIEMKFKADYYGVAVAREPRKIGRFEDSAWA